MYICSLRNIYIVCTESRAAQQQGRTLSGVLLGGFAMGTPQNAVPPPQGGLAQRRRGCSVRAACHCRAASLLCALLHRTARDQINHQGK